MKARIISHFCKGAAALLVVIGFTGCFTAPKRNPVPASLTGQAQVKNLPGVRVSMDIFAANPPAIEASLAGAVKLAREKQGPLTVLAISGGGPDGAFGAGLLNGWTEHGTRPVFDIVAGISTGALIAPFAFLGPEFDDELKQGYTTITDKDIYKRRSLFTILDRWDAAMDSTPLLKMLKRQFNAPVLALIATEHRKGRRMFVGTTDLDSQTLVAWDMGAIAASDRPEAGDLFCRVLLASASIPAAFPPVRIEVEAGGRQYDEMHVDGGVTTQVFGMGLIGKLMEMSAHKQGRMFVLRNAQFAREWKSINWSLPAISGRAISSLIKYNGLGDAYRAYIIAQEQGVEFNMASIPATFEPGELKGMFDPVYMNRLYKEGYDRARAGTVWQSTPPGLKLMNVEPDEFPAATSTR